MPEPLSVAAGIVGLVSTAVQITKIVTSVINKVRDAPEALLRIRTEVDDIRNILGQLQLFVTGTTRTTRSRTSLILVDQVVVTLAACVTTFSELDAFAHELKSETEVKVLDRFRWASNDERIKQVLRRVESHKTSLGLMMTILTCQKQEDAEDKVDKLCDLVQQVLHDNEFLRQRITTVEALLPAARVCEEGAPGVPDGTKECRTLGDAIRPFAFEELLMTSRPYRNATQDTLDAFSVVSSAGRTASWSMLSGLSLSEVSHIGILAIPIYPADISNVDAYVFELSTDDKVVEPGDSPSRAGTQQNASIFGVPLRDAVERASVPIRYPAIWDGRVIHGHVPAAVAKPAVFLKNRGIKVVEVFSHNGNPARIFHLEMAFGCPPYGNSPWGFSWAGYTVHDAAGFLLRYLKSLPEPVIPYDQYEAFTAQMRSIVGKELLELAETKEAREKAEQLIKHLPSPNRWLLFYLLDMLGVFASYSNFNKMTPHRLAAAFQPSILSGPQHIMDAEEYDLAGKIVVFLVENEDYLCRNIRGYPVLR
ncbi:Rho GTPase activation protein [Apodospora peruviana]|uniref:Rho GTPase activation protein n=1 Tax=Apodospora peruviana TaxID=516989 RepID=A0AAE0LZ96_9PEZI|nr:Rho GTPase activation protein [Apodospora peruviana]